MIEDRDEATLATGFRFDEMLDPENAKIRPVRAADWLLARVFSLCYITFAERRLRQLLAAITRSLHVVVRRLDMSILR
jgi:hypothetical protein